MQKFVIISTYRTGSTFLYDLLDSHPDIFCTGAVFQKEKFTLKHDIQSYLSFREDNDKDGSIENYLHNYIFADKDEYKAVGFKLMNTHISAEILAYFKEHNVKVLYLVRDNWLRKVISGIRADKHDIWSLGRDTDIKTKEQALSTKTTIDINILEDSLNSVKDIYRFMQATITSCAFDYLEIKYADLLNQLDIEKEKIFDFLGVENKEVSSSVVPSLRKNLIHCITNYDEVVSFLKEKHPEFLDAEGRYMDFIMLTRQRTGSTLLKNMLNSHPHLACSVELLLYRRDEKREGCTESVEKYLNSRVSLSRISGFKLMANQIYNEGCDGDQAIAYMEKYRPKILKLKRKNLLQTHVSNIRAIEFNVASSFLLDNDEDKLTKLKGRTVMIDVDTLLDDLQRVEDDYAYIDKIVEDLNLEYLDIFYTDIVEEFKGKKAVCDFLEVPVAKMISVKDKKTSPRNLAESITNYEEVVEIIKPLYPQFLEPEF